MSVLHRLPTTPDVAAMTEMVRSLFAHADRGKIELAWTSPRVPHGLTGARMFDVSELSELVEHAARMNMATNRNVYISAGLRRNDVAPDRRAGVDGVQSVAAIKVDCDTPGCIETALQICDALDMAPSYAMFTGLEPHRRGSLWWVLAAPTNDLSRVTRVEQALQSKFGSDPSVCEPSRLMRLAGSVAWPLKQGRVLEMTGALDTPLRAAPYTLDEIEGTLRAAGALPLPAPTAQILDFSRAEPQLDLDDLILRAAESGRWHDAALKAVAHLAGRGTPPDVILDVLTSRLQQPGYTWHQTRAELQVMLTGAAAKGMLRPARVEEEAEPEAEAEALKSPFVTIDDMLAMPPPSWLVQGYLINEGVSCLFGAPGSFKSFVALDIALSIAHGVPWRGFAVSEARKTLYICAEGQYGFGARGLVWRAHRGQGAECAGFWMLPTPVNFLAGENVDRLVQHIQQFGVDARFIVIDTLAKNFGDGDENGAQDMGKFLRGVDRLRAATRSHVLVVHHAGKDATKAERGSSALRGGVDAALHLIRDEQSERVLLKVLKQKDGPEADPLSLLCVKAEAVHPLTGEVIESRLPTLDEALIVPRGSSAPLTRKQRSVLTLLDAGSGLLATLAARSGTDKSNLRRTLNELQTMGFARVDENGVWEAVVISEPQGAQED